MQFQVLFKERILDLSSPKIMGILNVTPDSFSDGGKYRDFSLALKHAENLVRDGAHIVDVGGESTRPGATPVSTEEELDRVIPVIEAIQRNLDALISIDTSNPVVMKEAVRAGAHLVNDVRALTRPEALQTAAALDVPVCLMHMQGSPQTMQHSPQYENVVEDVLCYLKDRIEACEANGIQRANILIDPGFGFGKRFEDNMQLLRGLPSFRKLGCPIVVGLSRKSMIGSIVNAPLHERVHGNIAAAVIAVLRGANIVRVHEVAPTVQALAVAHETMQGEMAFE